MLSSLKKIGLFAMAFVLSAAIVSGSAFAGAEDVAKLDSRLRQSVIVLNEMEQMPDQGIPSDLLNKCAGVAIFPSVLKGGFGIGGMYGQGVLLRRDKATGAWSAPAFMSIGGASIGFQIGGQASDMILVIANDRGMEALSRNDVTLGGDASVAAGPVGRDASMDTDAMLRAGILSYSRSKGLFAGISLKGAIIGPLKNMNKEYYGADTTTEDILFSGKAQPTAEGQKLIDALNSY